MREEEAFKATGFHHVRLTVRDLERSVKFYSAIPGLELVADYPGFAMFSVGDSYLGLYLHDETGPQAFNETTVGLDHLAFAVSGSHEALINFLDQEQTEHSGEKTLSNGVVIVVFRDPDNIQLEFAFPRQKRKQR